MTKRTSNRLARLALRKQILLESLKSQEVRKFFKVFDKLDDLVIDVLSAQRVPDMQDLGRNKLQRLINDLTKKQGELFSEATEDWLGRMPAVAAYEAEHEVKSLKSVATPETRKAIATPAADLFKEARVRPIQSSGAVLDDVVAKWAQDSIDRTNNTIRLGHAQGLTVPQMVKRLVGSANLQFKDGTGAISKRHAATVVRTGVQHIANTSRAVTWEENSDLVLGYMWLSTLDGKTSPQCRALDHQHFELGKGPMPPIHPNCRSTTTPDLSKEFDFLDRGETRSSQDGYVDAKTEYYDFLAEQGASYQDAVLGAQRAKLFRDGGLSRERFRELQLDKNFMPITLAEMRKLEPEAFERAGL